MLFTIYGDLKEIHAYKGKTLIAERSANMKNFTYPALYISSPSLHFMKNALHLELQISQITQNRHY